MTRREDQMRQRIHDVEEQLVKAAIMITEAREERDEFRRLVDKGPAASIEAQAEINHWKGRAEVAEKERDDFRPAGEMLLALKARAEAAEKGNAKFMEQLRVTIDLAEKATARAEAAEKRCVAIEDQRHHAAVAAEAAEKERDNLGDSLRNYAALERIANERAEAAEKDNDRLLEWSSQNAVRAETAEDRAEKLDETLWRIKQWCEAYPLEVFPEPDLKKVAALLREHGLMLDSVSASAMRHVVTGIKKLIENKP